MSDARSVQCTGQPCISWGSMASEQVYISIFVERMSVGVLCLAKFASGARRCAWNFRKSSDGKRMVRQACADVIVPTI